MNRKSRIKSGISGNELYPHTTKYTTISHILILYIVFISILQYFTLTKYIHFITLYPSLPFSSPTPPYPNPIPETNKMRIHWLSPALIPIFIHITFLNISLIKIMIPSYLSTFPIALSFPPLFNYLLTP